MDENEPFQIDLAELEAISIQVDAVTTDLDVVNVFYFGQVPTPHQGSSELLSLMKIIEDWKAWETTKCEQAVELKIKQKQLPDDDSIASRSKRIAYRAKVLDFVRLQSPWITKTGFIAGKVNVPEGDPINLSIAAGLVNIKAFPDSRSYMNFLKAVGAGFSSNEAMVQPNYHTFIRFEKDQDLDKFNAVLQTVDFRIDLEHAEKDGDEQLQGAIIDYTETRSEFSAERWKESMPDPGMTEPGRKINVQKSLTCLE